MALINNVYVLVTDENIDRSAEIPSHPTESGLPLSDTIRTKPVIVSLSGKIVNVQKTKNKIQSANEICERLEEYKNTGALITYSGACGIINNLLIESFSCDYNYKNYGGANFEMTLKEIRVAKKAYVKERAKIKSVKTTTQIKVGEIVEFLGGNVYVASDSINPASERTKSMCKLTKISSLATRKHIYHLISEDDVGVYGWVDAERVKGFEKVVSPMTSGGTKRTFNTSNISK